jgi:hypothetical protein
MNSITGINQNIFSFGLLSAKKGAETTGSLAKAQQPLFNNGGNVETTGSVASSGSGSGSSFSMVA